MDTKNFLEASKYDRKKDDSITGLLPCGCITLSKGITRPNESIDKTLLERSINCTIAHQYHPTDTRVTSIKGYLILDGMGDGLKEKEDNFDEAD